MNTSSVSLLVVTLVASLASPAMAQNSTYNIGSNNIGNPTPVNPPAPTPTPCTFNCYGKGSKEQIIGGVIGGIIGGIIAGSSKKQQQAQQQQTLQPQPVQQVAQPQQSAGLSAEHYQWCANKYKSYKIATNSFTAYSGETRYCSSPFN